MSSIPLIVMASLGGAMLAGSLYLIGMLTKTKYDLEQEHNPVILCIMIGTLILAGFFLLFTAGHTYFATLSYEKVFLYPLLTYITFAGLTYLFTVLYWKRKQVR